MRAAVRWAEEFRHMQGGLSEFAAKGLTVRASDIAGMGVFLDNPILTGQLLLMLPPGMPSSSTLRRLLSEGANSDGVYQLAQALPPEMALRGISLPSSGMADLEQLAPLLSDPRQWRSVAAPRFIAAPVHSRSTVIEKSHAHSNSAGLQTVRLRSSDIFYALAKWFRSPQTSGYSVHGLLNHSCTPNAQRYFAQVETTKVGKHGQTKPPFLVLRATANIAIGQEILDSYFFPLVPLPERQSILQLLGKRSFDCNCRRCLQEYQTFGKDGLQWAENSWRSIRQGIVELAVLRSRRPTPKPLQAHGALVAGVGDPLLGNANAREFVARLQGILSDPRISCSSSKEREILPSWTIAAVILADLQVAVEGDFQGAVGTLAAAAAGLWSAGMLGAPLLEVLATRASYCAVTAAWTGNQGPQADKMADAVKELLMAQQLVLGPSPSSLDAGVANLWALPPLAEFLKHTIDN